MAFYTRNNMLRLGYGKAAILFAGCLIFSAGSREGGGLTLEQHLLSAASDHFYLTYFILPLVLFIIFSFIEDDGAFVLVRFRSYFSYFSRKWFCAGRIAFLIIVVQMAGILLSGIGLSLGNSWLLPSGSVCAELFSALRPYFRSPLSGFFGYMVFQFAGIWFLAGLAMWIGHFAGRKSSVKILMLLYIHAAYWIKIPALMRLPLTGINHLLILHHNLGSGNRIIITLITVLLLSILMLVTVRFCWCSRPGFVTVLSRGLMPYYMRELTAKKNLAVLGAVVAGIVLYKVFLTPYQETGEEWVLYLFAGHGTGYFHMISFLEMLIVNGSPLYLLAAFIQRAVNGQSYFISVRIKSRKELCLAIFTAGGLFLLLYCFLWLIGSILGLCLTGHGVRLPSLCYVVCSSALKLFDLLSQFSLMFAIYVYTKQITAGFLALTAGSFLCVVPLACMSYWPIGLSSMTRIDLINYGTGISPAAAFGTLSLFAAIIFLWLMLYSSHRLLD